LIEIAENQGSDGNAVIYMHHHQAGIIAIQFEDLHEFHQRVSGFSLI
jgi:hypothetical protein